MNVYLVDAAERVAADCEDAGARQGAVISAYLTAAGELARSYFGVRRTQELLAGLADALGRDEWREERIALAVGQPVLMRTIIERVADAHPGVSVKDILGRSRRRVVAQARQEAMARCRELTRKSLPEIGRYFGGRDHTTVLHAVRQVAARRGECVE